MNEKLPKKLVKKVVLITGGARRVGAEIARTLHHAGMNICIHYNHSECEAKELQAELNARRSDSALVVAGDLLDPKIPAAVIKECTSHWQRLDLLVNNASSYYPTEIGNSTQQHWNDLMGTNLQAPFFLCQAAVPWLKKNHGNVVNIIDIHATRPLKNYSIYCVAKAGLAMLTKCLAMELGPQIRVNGIAPGSIIWPEGDSALSEPVKDQILSNTTLGRIGAPQDIAGMLLFLIRDASYVTGQIIAVDGGLSL